MPKKLAKQPTSGSIASNSTDSTSAAAASTPHHQQLPAVLTDGQPLPRAIVFDLDYTLWPFWVDTHVYGPLKANSAHTACTDKTGETFAFYNDVPAILQVLSSSNSGVKLGVASRTSAPELAREMLKLLHVPASALLLDGASEDSNKKSRGKSRKAIEFFDAGLDIYPSSKIRHFEALGKRTGISFTDMLFFDDESRNRDTESLGVTMWLIRDGVTWDEIESGIMEWRRRRGYLKFDA